MQAGSMQAGSEYSFNQAIPDKDVRYTNVYLVVYNDENEMNTYSNNRIGPVHKNHRRRIPVRECLGLRISVVSQGVDIAMSHEPRHPAG